VLAVIARGEAVPEGELPVYPKAVKPRVPAPVQRRITALSQWRAEAAELLGIEPGILLPRRLIERLAEACPPDPQALGAIEGLRRWRIKAFGRELIRALRGTDEGVPGGSQAGRPERGGPRSGPP
jgi:ribonuclease D